MVNRRSTRRRRNSRRSGGGRLSRFGSRVGRSFRNLGNRMKSSAKRSKKYLRKKTRRLGRRFGYDNPSTVASIKSETNMPSMKSASMKSASMKSASMKSASKMPSMSSSAKYGWNDERNNCTLKDEYTRAPYYDSKESCLMNETGEGRHMGRDPTISCSTVMCKHKLNNRKSSQTWLVNNQDHEDRREVQECMLKKKEFCDETTGSKRRSKKSKRRSKKSKRSKRSKRRSGKRSRRR